jgi:hypothetical protein
MLESSSVAAQLAASQEGVHSMKLVNEPLTQLLQKSNYVLKMTGCQQQLRT